MIHLSAKQANLLALMIAILIVVGLMGLCLSQALPKAATTKQNMKWIQAGSFTMGSNEPYAMPNERPAHKVCIDGFFIDEHLVTNEDFLIFVAKTGYVTTAERPPLWEELKKQLPPGTKKPDDGLLVPGSSVFKAPIHPVSLKELSNRWAFTTGANWQHPEGPNSTIKGRENHPVVHVSFDDATAYASFVGKRLPTEAEWEYAARGGLNNMRYPWGNEFKVFGKHMANTFQGQFPHKQTAEDGYAGTSPVKSFPANGYGLFDMAGNVWQWTSDWYRDDNHEHNAKLSSCKNPQGPTRSFDHRDPYAQKRVIKGGSFLCHAEVCESYRPSARRGETPDTGTSHLGFRLVMSSHH